jgi:hypothetical protein
MQGYSTRLASPLPARRGTVCRRHDPSVRASSESRLMKMVRLSRMLRLAIPGLMLFQTTGCTWTEFNEFLQTILLGVTAAGAVAILQNI